MKLKTSTIFVILIVLILVIPKVISITGTNEDNNINITRGQLNTVSISTTSSNLIIRAGLQNIADLENDSTTRYRIGSLQSNAAPGTPILNSPPNNSFTNNTLIQFYWENSDENNDTLTSSFELFNDSSFTNVYHQNLSMSEQAYKIYYNVSVQEESTFYWRTKANDSEFNSSLSNENLFTIDTTLPTSFNLVLPANNTESTDTSPELAWLPTTETNLQNYTVEFCDSRDCSNISVKGTISDLSFTNWSTSGALAEGDHFWQIRATDKANNQNISEVFKYSVEASQTITTTTTAGGGGGETVGGSGTHLFSLSIISPPDITLKKDATITIPLIIKNPARLVTLQGIELDIASDSDDIIATLDNTLIPRLGALKQETVNLRIKTLGQPGTYGLTITARVKKPEFVDKVRILANLIELDSADKSRVSKQLSFAKELLDGNPQCLDLKEYINQAQEALEENNFDQALSLVENAVESCQKILQPGGLSIIQGSAIEIPYLIKENKTIIIIVGEVMGFVIFLLIIRKIIRKKKKEI